MGAGALVGGLGACTATTATTNNANTAASSAISLDAGSVILFQGDSITDGGRRRETQNPNNGKGLGSGFPLFVAGHLLGAYPELELKVFNRGISGSKVPQLRARWAKDCLALKPDLLSVLVGVNDLRYKLLGKYDGTVEDYQQQFTELLEHTRERLPDTRLVVCEPFVLRCGEVTDAWYPAFDQRREAAKRVAEQVGATWVPFQAMFDALVTPDAPPEYWARDGIHPSLAGHQRMAQEWIRVVLG